MAGVGRAGTFRRPPLRRVAPVVGLPVVVVERRVGTAPAVPALVPVLVPRPPLVPVPAAKVPVVGQAVTTPSLAALLAKTDEVAVVAAVGRAIHAVVGAVPTVGTPATRPPVPTPIPVVPTVALVRPCPFPGVPTARPVPLVTVTSAVPAAVRAETLPAGLPALVLAAPRPATVPVATLRRPDFDLESQSRTSATVEGIIPSVLTPSLFLGFPR